MSRRHAIELVLVMQHGGNALHLRITRLDLVQSAEQDVDVRINACRRLVHDVFHAGMRATDHLAD